MRDDRAPGKDSGHDLEAQHSQAIATDGGQDLPRLEYNDTDISTGDVVVDLASGKSLQVVGKSTQSVGEHRETRSDATAEMFGADADEPVFMCVYLPNGEKVSPPSKTYAYPESRLLRYPVEDATEYAGDIQTWLRTAFLDELADGVARSGNDSMAAELVALVGDVYDEEIAATFEEMIRSKGGEMFDLEVADR
ncbi:hypothetical protein [Natronomonas marina]|uniref:hypothetical protein n=1 Tax=Natronomonas marina TaxID=2961939 RepID=UPI0020C9A977|nr:hypothetical protein [Natronomonas marina]